MVLIRAALVACLALGLGNDAVATSAPSADVLIQAGHEGRPDCNVEPASLCRNTGAAAKPGEIVWTPIVADQATRVLRAAGVTVLREKAYLHGNYNVKTAAFIHFDGSAQPCGSRASVGFPKDNTQSAILAREWKALYGKYWPYGFQSDNFTSNLSKYYGYHHVTAAEGQFIVEGGDMNCSTQHAWLEKNLKWEGSLLAYFLSKHMGKGHVAFPGPPLK